MILKNKIQKLKSGFTLIELLVVIAIIGILAALALASFTTSQRQARDTQRKSDIKQFSTSLEAFANTTGGLYPSRNPAARASTTLCADLKMTNCSVDPSYTSDPTHDYMYDTDGTGGGTSTGSKYVLWDKLEGTPNYFVVCSTGKNGNVPVAGWSNPANGACPL